MTDENGNGDIALEIRSLLRKLMWATITLYVIVSVVTIGGLFYLKDQQDTTNNALCTFRNDLQNRVTQTYDFLKDHPQGFAGIPAAQLRTSAANQQATVNSLSSIPCPPPEAKLSAEPHK